SKNGVHVLNDNTVEVHVSGHACQEELKLMQALTKPKYFMPVHGEFRQLAANRELARSMGMEDRNIFVSEIGKVLEIDARQARFNGTVPSGVVLIDGSGVGDVGNVVLRDRLHLAQDGMVIVVAVVSSDTDELIAPPEIITRGFIYVKESEELMEAARKVAADTLEKGLSSKRRVDRVQLKNSIRDELSRFVLQKTKRRPMIIPVITYI
ncbi:MAG: ribonuclease J, partial [Clostridia bacterium]|nr:ribonuclease J [Clostridia bacterium]